MPKASKQLWTESGTWGTVSATNLFPGGTATPGAVIVDRWDCKYLIGFHRENLSRTALGFGSHAVGSFGSSDVGAHPQGLYPLLDAAMEPMEDCTGVTLGRVAIWTCCQFRFFDRQGPGGGEAQPQILLLWSFGGAVSPYL
jgi:hypothetical protein